MGREILFLDRDGGGDGGRHAEALKERAATALERAHRFVEEHGDDFARLRALVLLQARRPLEIERAVAAHQGPDGSFSPLGLAAAGAIGFDAAALSAPLLGTLEALAVLGDAGLLHAGCVTGAESHLRAEQREDGSWGAASDPGERIFATGMLAGLLGRTRVVRPSVLEAAGAFLAERWSPEQVEGGGFAPLCAFAHFFTNVHHERADEVLQWCGRELERAYRTRRLDAVSTLRVLVYCEAAALPGARFDVAELLEQVLGEQAADGGFAELAGGVRAARVVPSHDAMLAILRLCRAL